MADIGALLEVLDSPWLNRLRHEADSRVLLRSDISAEELPAGVTPDDAWRILTAIRHQTASVLPFDSYADIGYSTQTWYTVPRSMSSQLKAIDAICARSSAVDVALDDLKSSGPVMSLLEEELSFALAVECVPVTQERVHDVFTGARGAVSGLDRVIANFHALVYEDAPLAAREVTPSFVEELYWRLMSGAEDLELPSQTLRSYRPWAGSAYFDPRESRRAICEFASADDEAMFHPVIRLACISWLCRDFHAVPNLNAVVEIVLRHVLTRQWGCPALGWLPFNRNDLHVGEGVFRDALNDYGYGLDSTYLLCKITEYTLEGARKLARVVREAHDLEADVERRLSGTFNARQRAIVASALQSPQTSFRIEPHRQRHGITYPTARNDFLQLEEQGYLVRKQEGRAFVFRAAPGLARRLGEERP